MEGHFERWVKNLNTSVSKEDTQMTCNCVKKWSTSYVTGKCKTKPQFGIHSHWGCLYSLRWTVTNWGGCEKTGTPTSCW